MALRGSLQRQPSGWRCAPRNGDASIVGTGLADGSRQEEDVTPDLYFEVRRIGNLWTAWRHIKARGLLSASKEIRAEVAAFDAEPIRNIRSIQDRLKAGTFHFVPQKGVTKTRPGKRPRPIVIAPVKNRIVQRAILQVLQEKCAPVRAVLDVPTSVGGIEGTDVAIERAMEAMAAGAAWFVRSDIADFFTKIPKAPIIKFIRDACQDDQFVDLFEQAITVILENMAALGADVDIFPLGDVGIAQGSALSPMIGNILLNDFDQKLNGRGITCIRYIDDFLILAPSRRSALSAFNSARGFLAVHQLNAYDPATHPNKAAEGPCKDGFDFLGCRVIPGLVQPSKSAQDKLLARVRTILDDGLRTMVKASQGKDFVGRRHVQTLSHVDRVVKGWGDAFAFCNGRQSFPILDNRIQIEINRLDRRASKLIDVADLIQSRRARGIFVLADIPTRIGGKKNIRALHGFTATARTHAALR